MHDYAIETREILTLIHFLFVSERQRILKKTVMISNCHWERFVFALYFYFLFTYNNYMLSNIDSPHKDNTKPFSIVCDKNLLILSVYRISNVNLRQKKKEKNFWFKMTNIIIKNDYLIFLMIDKSKEIQRSCLI